MKATPGFEFVQVLINNAGIVSGSPFLETPPEKMELTMKVNTIAHFWTAKAFLPEMLKQRYGHIVTVASAAGLMYEDSRFSAMAACLEKYQRISTGVNGIRQTSTATMKDQRTSISTSMKMLH